MAAVHLEWSYIVAAFPDIEPVGAAAFVAVAAIVVAVVGNS